MKIRVPDSLSEITLNRYKDYIKIQEPTDLDTISSLCGLDKELLIQISAKSIEEVARVLNNVLIDTKTDNIQTIKKFTMNGVKYGMIPNLDEMSYGENEDITNFLSDWETMDKAMMVMYRPIVKDGDSYEIEQYDAKKHLKQDFSNISIDIVLGAIVFFYRLTKELLKATQSYLLKEMKKNPKIFQEKEFSGGSGESMKRFTVLLKEMSEDLMKLLPYHYINV